MKKLWKSKSLRTGGDVDDGRKHIITSNRSSSNMSIRIPGTPNRCMGQKDRMVTG